MRHAAARIGPFWPGTCLFAAPVQSRAGHFAQLPKIGQQVPRSRTVISHLPKSRPNWFGRAAVISGLAAVGTLGGFDGVTVLRAATHASSSHCSPPTWHVVETANFRILNYGRQPVETDVADQCEQLRASLVGRWLGNRRRQVAAQVLRRSFIRARPAICAKSGRPAAPPWPRHSSSAIAAASPCAASTFATRRLATAPSATN